MSNDPSALRVAKAVGLFASTAAATGTLSISAFVIPRILESPTDLMLRQWLHMYNVGKFVFPGVAVVAALAHGYVYTSLRRTLGTLGTTAATKLPLAAAGLVLAIMPYTVLVLFPTNAQLTERATAAEASAQLTKADRAAGAGVVYTAQQEASARQLVDRWGVLSLGRAALAAASAVTGMMAYL